MGDGRKGKFMPRSRSNGWTESAEAWISEIERGDFNREFILDRPMMERIHAQKFTIALDVGCGEGRFCRMLRSCDIRAVGIDPTEALIGHARQSDPSGDYMLGRAEELAFANGTFDLVVCYLTLVNVADISKALEEITRVLRPRGTLLIANLNSFVTAAFPRGWVEAPDGTHRFCIDRYSDAHAEWVSWSGIRVLNWHRPLETYMSLLLEQGLQLTFFSEPLPIDGDPARCELSRRVPYFLVMEWQKP
jgi:2-polyprenyl-3-methyl-5-hydroxy-6-metoxy-1,4-benzoquinol methylase